MIERITVGMYFVWRLVLVVLVFVGWMLGMLVGTVVGGIVAGFMRGYKG